MPWKLTITLPSFIPQKLFKEQIGSLSAVSIKTDEQGYISSPDRPLIDEQRVVTDINTQYTASIKLRGASCLSDENVWTCSFDEKIMKLYNLKGELVKKKFKTKSGNSSCDIVLTTSGELIYSDVNDRAVNISNNT